jgi:CYTH domain-containing protein
MTTPDGPAPDPSRPGTPGDLGKPGKYALVERERRFLLGTVPPFPADTAVREITDRYVTGTRLRLRRSRLPGAGGRARTELKLTQKVPAASGGAVQGLITTFYLSEAEYEALLALPARVLRKTRRSLPPLGVDVFEGPLAGLVLAEAEFGSDEEAAAFAVPPFAVAEVTADPRFTGGRLARTSPEELRALLAGFGLP